MAAALQKEGFTVKVRSVTQAMIEVLHIFLEGCWLEELYASPKKWRINSVEQTGSENPMKKLDMA